MNSVYEILLNGNIEDFDLKYINHEIFIKNGNYNTNMGSPLYISCINYNEIFVDFLLKNNADYKYKYVSSNYISSPLIHCAKLGYNNIIDIFIKYNKIDYKTRTEATYYVLTKGINIYEYGGYNLLFICIEEDNFDLFKKLVNTKYKNEWIKEKDVLGYTIIDLLNIKKNDNSKYIKYMELLDINAEQGNNIKEDIKINILEYNNRMKKICEENSLVIKEKYIKNRQENISKFYTPQHKYLTDNTFSFKIDINNMTVNKNYDILFINDLLNVKDCLDIKDEIINYKIINEENPQYNLPYFIRHDGNLAELSYYNYNKLINEFLKIINILIKKNYPNAKEQILSQSFLIYNNINRKQNFKIHKDNSDFTFNLCLYKSHDLQGSTVGFYKNNDDINYEYCEKDRIFTYEHSISKCILHQGKKVHKADNLIKGERISLIIWTKNI